MHTFMIPCQIFMLPIALTLFLRVWLAAPHIIVSFELSWDSDRSLLPTYWFVSLSFSRCEIHPNSVLRCKFAFLSNHSKPEPLLVANLLSYTGVVLAAFENNYVANEQTLILFIWPSNSSQESRFPCFDQYQQTHLCPIVDHLSSVF
jgi:hypothetical protein